MTTNTGALVTTTRIGSGATELVFLSGREVGSVITNDTFAQARIVGARGMFKFATREDAIAACVSYTQRGYWTGEIS